MKCPARLVTARLKVLLVGLLPLCLAPNTLIGGERDPASPDGSEPQRPFTLTIRDNRLSLQAQHAPLKEVMEAVGQQLGIEVVARISPEERVTVAFEQLTLEETLTRFRRYARIVYQTRRAGEAGLGRISTIYIFPKTTATNGRGSPEHMADHVEPGQRRLSDSNRRESPRPFKFEFDPSAVMQETK